MDSIIGTNLVGKKVEITAGSAVREDLVGEIATIAVVYTEKSSDNVLFALTINENGMTGKQEIVEGFYTNNILILPEGENHE